MARKNLLDPQAAMRWPGKKKKKTVKKRPKKKAAKKRAY